MTTREINLLASLDKDIDRRLHAMTPEAVRLYRSLLTKYVSEMSVVILGESGQKCGMSPLPVGVA